jgi:hypothetical protein
VPEPALHLEKLRELLAEQHESERLDYKRELDLRDKRAELELIKDIAAMQPLGGYIVIGADDRGAPSGALTQEQARHLDETIVRAKAARFLPEPLVLRLARHTVDANELVLLYVGPHPDGFVIFKADGNVGGDIIFRQGEVFVRHGSASERWRQEDVDRVRARLRDGIVSPAGELVAAPPSLHRREDPRRVVSQWVVWFQRVFIELENVGDNPAKITHVQVQAHMAGSVMARPPSAIGPRSRSSLELNVQSPSDTDLPSGTDFELLVRYETAGRTRELRQTVRYYRGGSGWENGPYETAEA